MLMMFSEGSNVLKRPKLGHMMRFVYFHALSHKINLSYLLNCQAFWEEHIPRIGRDDRVAWPARGEDQALLHQRQCLEHASRNQRICLS